MPDKISDSEEITVLDSYNKKEVSAHFIEERTLPFY